MREIVFDGFKAKHSIVIHFLDWFFEIIVQIDSFFLASIHFENNVCFAFAEMYESDGK